MSIPDAGNDPYEPRLYEAIGRFTVAFAMVEMTANAIGAVIFNGYGGRRLRARLPKTTSLMSEFLLQAADNLEELGYFADDLRANVNRLSSLLDARHFIVHGLHGETENGQPVFGKPLVTRDNMYMLHMPATFETIWQHYQSTILLASSMAGFALRLSDHLSPAIQHDH